MRKQPRVHTVMVIGKCTDVFRVFVDRRVGVGRGEVTMWEDLS